MRVPGTTWRPLSEADDQPAIRPTQIIVHTAVDAPGPTSLFGYFENSTTLESHLFIRWDRTEQYVDTLVRADANYLANRRPDGTGAISIETEDDGSPVQNPWNAFQLDELVRIIVLLCREHGIPARLCRNPDDPGLGWHAMFGAPSKWTNAAGKTCPGSTRIAQFKNVVLPRVQAALAAPTPTPTPSEEDEDMNKIVWFKDDAGGVHAYNLSGVTGKWLSWDAYQAQKYIQTPELNTGNNAWGPNVREGYYLVDGPCRNVIPSSTATVVDLDDAELAAIAKAVNDEAHRRSAG
jgi:hypothetical protein